MKRSSFRDWPCSIARTVDVLGDAWTLLVLRELCYGETRFDAMVTSLGIPRATLSGRLSTLVDHGLLERSEYQVDPVRHEYLLSDQGRDFFGVLVALNAWGDRWLAKDGALPVVMDHESCGHALRAQVTCEHCGEEVRLGDVGVRPGPGYPATSVDHPSVVRRFARTSTHD